MSCSYHQNAPLFSIPGQVFSVGWKELNIFKTNSAQQQLLIGNNHNDPAFVNLIHEKVS